MSSRFREFAAQRLRREHHTPHGRAYVYSEDDHTPHVLHQANHGNPADISVLVAPRTNSVSIETECQTRETRVCAAADLTPAVALRVGHELIQHASNQLKTQQETKP